MVNSIKSNEINQYTVNLFTYNDILTLLSNDELKSSVSIFKSASRSSEVSRLFESAVLKNPPFFNFPPIIRDSTFSGSKT